MYGNILLFVLACFSFIMALALFGHSSTVYLKSKADPRNPYWHSILPLYSIGAGVWFIALIAVIHVVRH